MFVLFVGAGRAVTLTIISTKQKGSPNNPLAHTRSSQKFSAKQKGRIVNMHNRVSKIPGKTFFKTDNMHKKEIIMAVELASCPQCGTPIQFSFSPWYRKEVEIYPCGHKSQKGIKVKLRKRTL